jgi:GTPase SAR1 family protein
MKNYKKITKKMFSRFRQDSLLPTFTTKKPDSCYRILVLGDSGVGKSTFIACLKKELSGKVIKLPHPGSIWLQVCLS